MNDASMIGGVVIGLIGFAVFIGICLLLREVFCWYWKINQMISIQNTQIANSQKLLKQGSEQIKLLEEILKATQKSEVETRADNFTQI